MGFDFIWLVSDSSLITAIMIIICSKSLTVLGQNWTPIVVKNIIYVGLQNAPSVTNVSRDGGHSVLINGNIVWLYDDTECFGYAGNQLSFVSNTAAFSSSKDISTVDDFGVVLVGQDMYGRNEYAILADTTVGTGGWIPFLPDELEFNDQKKGSERVAIWPGTSPTPISTIQAFMYAPLVYVDSKPQDPSKEYQARGMTLVTITAPSSGPVATRQGDLIIPGTEVAFGGFATLLGFTSVKPDTNPSGRDIYLVGIAEGGLQVARAALNDILAYSKYSFFDAKNLNFSGTSPALSITNYENIYLPGSFSSGSIFYSPYFRTFIMVYFNKLADSTFYIRYLDLNQPYGNDPTWIVGGKGGKGIVQEDAEAIVKYAWSPQQQLYVSPTGEGGFNYAGSPHPEYFNKQYFAQSLYPSKTPVGQRLNKWYGAEIVPETDTSIDGRHLLLSWTSQLHGGKDSGIYQVCLAVVEFDQIPAKPGPSPTFTAGTSPTTVGMPSKTPGTGLPSQAESLRGFWSYIGQREDRVWACAWEVGLLGAIIVGASSILLM